MPELRAAIIPVTRLQQNCTLVWDEATKRAMVVDPGGDVPDILDAIAKLGLSVERILLTHGHIDHAGGAADLKAALPGAVLQGPDERDAFLLDGLAESGAQYGIDARPVRPDEWLHEGDVVTLGEHRFDVLHCPGHTPGHVVFVNHAAGMAFVGDVLFQGSVGRTDFVPYGDTDALLRSIRDKIMTLPDTMAFICGHGSGSTIGAERRSNPYVTEALALRG